MSVSPLYRSGPLRRVLFQVHLWVGVAAALYVLVVSVTGAALVFRIHLQRAVHPKLLTARTDGPQADMVTVLERVRDAYPRGRLSGVDAPTTVRPTHLAYVTEDGRFRTVLSDPVTAEVLGELPEHSVVRTLQDLHFDLLAGSTGRVINGIGALCLLLLCATGPFIWWPGRAGWRRGLAVDWGRPWKRVTWELHGAVGIWTLVLTAGWAVTGAYFVFPDQFRAAVDSVSPLTTVRPPQSNPDHRAYAPRPTWREMVDLARRAEPDAFVARVVLPATDEASFRVLFADRRPTPLGSRHLRTVHLDQYTGERLSAPEPPAATPGDTVMAWIGPLHFGNFGGPGIRAVWLVTGLAPGLLAATGLILWWTRVVAPRWRRRRVPEVALQPGAPVVPLADDVLD
ncbi:MAG: PepSY-associated TM helix domain-containing protein [Acidobacteriota bacterium]|nr:PepSY-associated TM helix domain-containing protein [Acidobacteriota bacterium]